MYAMKKETKSRNRNHCVRDLPMLGTPGCIRLSTATGPSMYFCLFSGFSISFISGQ
jgi:hypothetical protein